MRLKAKLMRKSLSVLLVSGMAASSFTGLAKAEVVAPVDSSQIYVAATGNDVNGDGTQGNPYATVAKAKDKVREIVQALPNQKMTSDIIVNIAQGDYYLNQPLEFNATDSGTNGHNVIYRSADGIGKANLIGGTKINGWQKSTDDDVAAGLLGSIKDKVYKVKLDPTTFNFNALYVNDNKAIMARTQNKEYDPRFPASAGAYMHAAGGGMHDISYNSGDLDQRTIDGMVKAQQAGATEIAQLFTWDGPSWDWFTDTIPIKAIDTSTRKLTFPQNPQKPELYVPKYPIGGGSRYYLQGNIAFLDVPGEYFYNKQTGDLYYYPKADDGSVDQWTVVAPTMQKILYFKGDEKGNGSYADYKLAPDPLKQTHNIKIDGLTLKDTEYTNYFTSGWNETDAGGGLGTVPPESAGSTLPAYSEQTDRVEYKVGAVTMINTNNITIENTKIRNIGLFGIAMYRDNDHNTITNSDIGFVGYGGITSDGGYPGVGKYNNFHTITNVAIHDIGQNIGHAAGISWMDTGNSNISHIEIYNSPRRAIMTSAGIRRNSLDSNYDELRDMYTINNRYSYINIHDVQQDGGEDSAIFWVYLLRGGEMLARHGSDPNVKTENGARYYDVGEGKYNYLDQVIVDGVGANPSMHDKNTVHGMDLTMGGSGTHLSNIKVTNPQSKTMRIEETVTSDKFHMDNLNNNYKNDNILNLFDDSKMEYDKIGLTSDFPFERYHKVVSKPNTNDMYFQDDFESGKLNLLKWNIEKGKPNINQVYMSEGAFNGKYSLATDGNKNKGGVVVSRKFANDLNKVVEVQYFDKRQDYASSDAGEGGGSYDITPNAFVRVDNGSDIVALGANGDLSKDYFVYKAGANVVTTNVKRSYGWHNFKFDYTSLTDVKMYIDGTLVVTLPKTSFNYIGMGDWEGKGGEAYFDQLYVYGGSAAPAVQDLTFPIVSLNKPATASGSSAGYTPEKANDDSDSSMWSADSAAPGSWWQVDLQKKQNIYAVDINFSSSMKYTELTSLLQSAYINMPKSITFQVSDDGSNWTTVRSKVTDVPTNNSYSRSEPKAQTYSLYSSGRYLRLLFEDGAQGTGIDMKEVSVTTKDQFQFTGIKAPAAITLSGGAAKTAEALGLPKTVKLATDGVDADASVVWNVEASSYDPSQKYISQTFTVTGTVTLPTGFQNPNNIPLTTSISVTVESFGVIQAENYTTMSGIVVEDCSEGGKSVGWIDPGDWMDYLVNVPSTGVYKINYRVAANSATGSVNFLVDGVSKKITSFPSTGGWQNWATVSSDTFTLSEGPHTIRLLVVQSGWNLNKFELSAVGGTLQSIQMPSAITGVANGKAKTAAALGLPVSVALVTNAGNINADVTWNVDASSYDPSQTSAQTFNVGGTVTLPAGVLNPNNVGLTTSISVTVLASSPPQSSITIEAENYAAMSNVKVESGGSGGSHVGWLDPNDWMEYNVNIPTTGKYAVIYTVAVNVNKTGKVKLLVDGVSQKDTTLPSTGDWNNYATVSDSVTLSKGVHTIRFQVVQSDWNFDKFELKLLDTTLVSIQSPAAITGVVNGTAKTAAALGLPATVVLVTDGGNVNADVAWNVDASSYDPTRMTQQLFTVNGTITLPAGVVNPNNVAFTTSVSVTVLPAPTPKSTLTGVQQVLAGQTFTLTLGLTDVTQSVYQQVYAQDFTLSYDPASVQFDSVTSLIDGFRVIDKDDTVPGHIRIVVASVGAIVPVQGNMLAIHFKAISITQATNTTIVVDHVVIANAPGNELQVNGASREIQITIPSTPVDKSLLNATITSAQAKYAAAVEGNKDGLYAVDSKAQLQSAINAASAIANSSNATQQQVNDANVALEEAVQLFDSKLINADINGNGISIGDLALVSKAYGKEQGQVGWNEKADVNHDGKVDIEDLAIVAKAILQ